MTDMHATAAAPVAAGQMKLVLDVADRDLGRSIAGALQDLHEPPPEALTIFENGNGAWRIEAYFAEPMDGAHVSKTLAGITGLDVPAFVAEAVPDLNWVTISQSALPPVAAGRFTVHGSHDAWRVPRGPNAILIDAGEAFGTAHHATTHGCLMALDRLTRARRFGDCLDLGCGSGVLAIALARALPHARIVATDIDAQSVAVAANNMRVNGAGRRVEALVASGLDHPRLRRPASFDLIVANILAEPLVMLAPAVARALRSGAHLVVSGLLVPQAPEVIAAYRAHGVALVHHHREAGWSTLTLVTRKPAHVPRAPARSFSWPSDTRSHPVGRGAAGLGLEVADLGRRMAEFAQLIRRQVGKAGQGDLVGLALLRCNKSAPEPGREAGPGITAHRARQNVSRVSGAHHRLNPLSGTDSLVSVTGRSRRPLIAVSPKQDGQYLVVLTMRG